MNHLCTFFYLKKCSTKLFSKAFPKPFKFIFHQMQSFSDKSHFYSSFTQFWVIEYSRPILEKTEKFNFKANAKAISTFENMLIYI